MTESDSEQGKPEVDLKAENVTATERPKTLHGLDRLNCIMHGEQYEDPRIGDPPAAKQEERM